MYTPMNTRSAAGATARKSRREPPSERERDDHTDEETDPRRRDERADERGADGHEPAHAARHRRSGFARPGHSSAVSASAGSGAVIRASAPPRRRHHVTPTIAMHATTPTSDSHSDAHTPFWGVHSSTTSNESWVGSTRQPFAKPSTSVRSPSVATVGRGVPARVVGLTEHEPERLVRTVDVDAHPRPAVVRDLDLRRGRRCRGQPGDASVGDGEGRAACVRREHEPIELHAGSDAGGGLDQVVTGRELDRRRSGGAGGVARTRCSVVGGRRRPRSCR